MDALHAPAHDRVVEVKRLHTDTHPFKDIVSIAASLIQAKPYRNATCSPFSTSVRVRGHIAASRFRLRSKKILPDTLSDSRGLTCCRYLLAVGVISPSVGMKMLVYTELSSCTRLLSITAVAWGHRHMYMKGQGQRGPYSSRYSL